MNKKQTAVWIITLLLVLLAYPVGQAHAYLDPGSGSMIIQIVIAGIAGLLIAGRVFWTRMAYMLRFKQRPVERDTQGEPTIDA